MASKKFLDYDGLLYFWNKIKLKFIKVSDVESATEITLADVATSGSYEDLTDKPTIPEGVEPTTTTPKMDGTATVGTEVKFARGDHIHPHDTSKVDKESGKGLSTNDYTTAEKNKLAGIASGAEVNQNAFSNVVVGTTTIVADAKQDTLTLVAGDNITLTPDATNDKVTIAVNTSGNLATQAYVDQKVAQAGHLKREIVTTLPAVADADLDTIYMKLETLATGQNVYSEWIVIENASTHVRSWEQIGTSSADLSQYWAKVDLVVITNTEIDTITNT